MILDDLFEQKPLPSHIKASDLPPGMRTRLTMRDIERERPRGAYRYRVIPGTPGESPKDFVDLPGAEQYAQAVRGRVQPLEEQVSDPDVQRGMSNLNAIEKQQNTNIKVMWQNETGRPAFQIELPVDKQWMISHAQEWIDAGRANDLYKYMGTKAGQEFLLAAWQKEDTLRDKRARDVSPEEPDLFSGQAGGPKSPRYQDESQHGQKKSPRLTEQPRGATARTARMLSQMRARQPQAASDLEALAYELQDAERRDAEEINKLEREVDNLETDIKSDLQKRIATLTRRRGGIQQAAAADVKIDTALDQLAKVNDQQQRDIDTLSKAVATLGQRPSVIGSLAPVQAPTAPVATTSPAIGQAVQTLTRRPEEAPTSSGGTMTATPTGVIHRAAQREPEKVSAVPRLQTAPGSSGERISRLRALDTEKTGQDDLFRQAAESALQEKKKPVATNPDLWSRAKSAARSKFDVYPSAYANAWAAKWYKSKGGGWRMGKPKKK